MPCPPPQIFQEESTTTFKLPRLHAVQIPVHDYIQKHFRRLGRNCRGSGNGTLAPPQKKKISESALLLRKRALPSLSTLLCEWDTCDVLELVNKQTNNQSLFRRSQGGES